MAKTKVEERKKTELSAILAAPPYPSLADAAHAVGLNPQTVYNLNSEDAEWRERWQSARAAWQATERKQRQDELEARLPAALAAIDAGLEAEDDPALRARNGWRLIEQVFGEPEKRHKVSAELKHELVIAFDE